MCPGGCPLLAHGWLQGQQLKKGMQHAPGCFEKDINDTRDHPELHCGAGSESGIKPSMTCWPKQCTSQCGGDAGAEEAEHTGPLVRPTTASSPHVDDLDCWDWSIARLTGEKLPCPVFCTEKTLLGSTWETAADMVHGRGVHSLARLKAHLGLWSWLEGSLVIDLH